MSHPVRTCTDAPVSYRPNERSGVTNKFPMKFSWHQGAWFELFERHANHIKQEVARHRAEGLRIAYLSCPISAGSGGFTKTNVEITKHVTKSIEKLFGDSFWVLNPAMYQMESKAGTGLIERHARLHSLESGKTPIDLAELHRTCPPSGGDYLRMWSRVLIEDDTGNLGDNFDMYYFMGPSDAWSFFSKDESSVFDGVEDYLARKMTLDPEYREYFTDKEHGVSRCNQFIEYYGLKIGAGFSRGSRDELNIWRTLNSLRVKRDGLGAQIPAFSEGHQLNLLDWGDQLTGYSSSCA